MRVLDYAENIGKICQYEPKKGIVFDVKIVDLKSSYTIHLDYLVEPVAGSGSMWVRYKRSGGHLKF